MPKKALPDDDIVKPRGVGLKISEWQEVDEIADELGWKPHAVLVYAVRYFLKAYRDGEIKTKTRTTKELPEI